MIFIPICSLVPLVVVWLVLEVDMQFLENEFMNDYKTCDMVIYVSIYD